MSIRALLFSGLVSSAALAGCAKANDLGRIQEDTIALAHAYEPVIQELTARANELRKATPALAPDAASHLRDAFASLQHMSGLINGDLSNVKKNTTESPEDAQKRTDNLEDHLREGVIVATDHIEAVESWLAVAERTPVRAPAATP